MKTATFSFVGARGPAFVLPRRKRHTIHVRAQTPKTGHLTYTYHSCAKYTFLTLASNSLRQGTQRVCMTSSGGARWEGTPPVLPSQHIPLSGANTRDLYRIPCAALEANDLEERGTENVSSIDMLFSGLYEWQESAILGLPLVTRYSMEQMLVRLRSRRKQREQILDESHPPPSPNVTTPTMKVTVAHPPPSPNVTTPTMKVTVGRCLAACGHAIRTGGRLCVRRVVLRNQLSLKGHHLVQMSHSKVF